MEVLSRKGSFKSLSDKGLLDKEVATLLDKEFNNILPVTNNVDTVNISDGAVDTDQIAPDAVTGDEIAPGAIDNTHLSPGIIEPANLEDGLNPTDPTTAPVAVAGFRLWAISWSAYSAPYDLSYYSLEFSTSLDGSTGWSAWEALSSTTGKWYVHSSLDVALHYRYRYKAVDIVGNESGYSPTVVAGLPSQIGSSDIAYAQILAEHISVTDLASIVSKTGHLIAGDETGERVEIYGGDSGGQIDIYDKAGLVRATLISDSVLLRGSTGVVTGGLVAKDAASSIDHGPLDYALVQEMFGCSGTLSGEYEKIAAEMTPGTSGYLGAVGVYLRADGSRVNAGFTLRVRSGSVTGDIISTGYGSSPISPEAAATVFVPMSPVYLASGTTYYLELEADTLEGDGIFTWADLNYVAGYTKWLYRTSTGWVDTADISAFAYELHIFDGELAPYSETLADLRPTGADADSGSFLIQTGMVVDWPTWTTPPAGWLYCDNTAYNNNDYPNLAALMRDFHGYAASVTVTADAGTDKLSAASHGLVNADRVYLSTSGTLPGGLDGDTLYYVVEKTPDDFKVSLTSGGAAVNLTSTGSGTHEAHTQFRVPDRKGRVPVGYDYSQTEFDNIGETGGATTHTLTVYELAAHTHIQNPHGHYAFIGGTDGGDGAAIDYASSVGAGAYSGHPYIVAATATNQATGNDVAHNNLQPYNVTYFIIKT